MCVSAEQDRGEDEAERGGGGEEPAAAERRGEIQQPQAVPDSSHSPQDEEMLAGEWRRGASKFFEAGSLRNLWKLE